MAPQTTILAADNPLPPLRDWVSTAGFTGACLVLAALIFLAAALVSARRSDKRHTREMDQRDQHHQDTRDADQRAAAIEQCWQRLTWVITTADTEPAALDPATANMGLGPELAEELLNGIVRDAKELGDETLERAAAVALNQLGLVLTQQARRLTEVATATQALTDGKAGAHAAKPAAEVKPQAQGAVKDRVSRRKHDGPTATSTEPEAAASEGRRR
ncbi:hypothetical protein EB73_08405 [Mycobacterium sp. SWH-M3]|nr:hypothetical protein EB73_08405 [Mycobacterium sp. SWH-M3]